MSLHLRIARPVTDLKAITSMYSQGLGLSVIGSFADHDGFDGVMLGKPSATYHFEFTKCKAHPVLPGPTCEDLVIFYIPEVAEWETTCANMSKAGFKQVAAFNPYWDMRGKSYEDIDGYRVVLQHDKWHPK